MPDIRTWTVVYRDGSRFPEMGPDGHRHGFAEAMAHGEVAAVELTLTEMPECPPIRVQIPSDAVRPIFFRRRTVSFNDPDATHTITALGWQKTIRVGEFERNVKAFVWIHPDGAVELTDRDRDG